jgi:hemerythrin-like metal-binding protein
MAVFVWSSQFELKIKVIDEQHKVLVALINDLEKVIAKKKTAQYSSVFSNLIKYTRYHFITEEALMLASGFPLSDVNAHIKQHKQFIEELDSVCSDESYVSEGDLNVILSFLTNWLTNHICKVDRKLATHIHEENEIFSRWEEKLHAKESGGTQNQLAIEIDYKSLMGYFHEIIRHAEEDIKNVLFCEQQFSTDTHQQTIEKALKKISMVRKAIGRLSLSH